MLFQLSRTQPSLAPPHGAPLSVTDPLHICQRVPHSPCHCLTFYYLLFSVVPTLRMLGASQIFSFPRPTMAEDHVGGKGEPGSGPAGSGSSPPDPRAHGVQGHLGVHPPFQLCCPGTLSLCVPRSYVWGHLFCVQGDQSLVSSSPQPRIENPIENTFMSLSLLVSLLSLALSSGCPLTRLSHSLWSLAVSLLLHRTFLPSFPALSSSVSSRLSLPRPPPPPQSPFAHSYF